MTPAEIDALVEGSPEFNAAMWCAWAAINDRISAELPVGYEVRYSMIRLDFAVLLVGPGDELIIYRDPPKLNRFGIVFQILEAALERAKEHAAAVEGNG